jgi:hypothetical protein
MADGRLIWDFLFFVLHSTRLCEVDERESLRSASRNRLQIPKEIQKNNIFDHILQSFRRAYLAILTGIAATRRFVSKHLDRFF